ncbi:MAG: sulfatase-like hydrolase/transferase [Akkermansia sp.]|nr:sulfatase-like hydrolase/transferase [Akkermansia sp.]
MFRWVKSHAFFLILLVVAAACMSWKGMYTWRVDFEFPWWGYLAIALPLLGAGGMLLARHLKKQVLPRVWVLWVVLLLSFAVDSVCNLFAYSTPWQLHLSVLMTMGCMLLLWAVFRASAIAFWVIFLVLEIMQICSYQQYGSRINSLVVAETIEASWEEALAYMTPINLGTLALSFVLSLLFCWAIKRTLRKEPSLALFNGACIFCGTSLLLGLLVPPNKQKQDFYWPAPEIPLLYSAASEALTINEATINQVESLSSPAEQPSKLHTLRGGEGVVFVLHIGESIRADRMSLNGYERDTTPWLRQQRNLVNFPTCISAACDTCQAQIAILTNGRRDIYEKRPGYVPTTGSVLDLFHANGFEMYSFFGRRCAQKLKYDRVVLVLSRKSREKFNAPGSPWTAVPQMQQVLQNTPKGQNLLFFVNNEGSHTPFEHFDRENTPFAPAATHFQNPAAQAVEVNNAYDSSIHYTDEFFRRVAELLGNRPFVYVYVSDHGEYLGHDGMWGRAALGEQHISYHSTDGCKVGMFVLYNDAFASLNPHFASALQQLRANSSHIVAHEHIFHTVLGLFKLETPHYDSSLDLTSPSAQSYDGPKP